MVKDSSLVSVLGVADITQMGKVYASGSFRFFETYSIVAYIYLILTVGLSLWSGECASTRPPRRSTEPAKEPFVPWPRCHAADARQTERSAMEALMEEFGASDPTSRFRSSRSV
jgi:hypothetical protein